MKRDFRQTLRMATLMEKRSDAAVRVRIRYLLEDTDLCILDDSPIAHFWANENIDEIEFLLKQDITRKRLPSSRVSESKIDDAKNYPIQNLVDFSRGKAFAWCHEDRRPSLYQATRINKAVCPVCNKYFSPIDVLMERDGRNFREAIAELTGGL